MLRLGREAARISEATRLGGLYRIVPKSLVKKILRQCGQRTRAGARLPAGLVLWFVLALGLFCRDCYRQVFRSLSPYCPGGVPGRSTLCQARYRLGVRPLVLLVQQVVQLLARPDTPESFHRGMRLMALDGWVLDLPDSPANVRVFGRSPGSRGASAFPQLRVLALCEAGTHVIWRFVSKPVGYSEQSMCPPLLRELQSGMLLMWDRAFLSFGRLQEVTARGAYLLCRIQKSHIFEPMVRLLDGSYLARIYPSKDHRHRDTCGVTVRIIEYTFSDPGRPGAGQRHRLLTTLLDAHLDPAKELIELYHQRWEEELAIDEIKTHQMERPVLRSQTPAGVIQELYALLLDHYIVRVLMHEAAKQCGMPSRRMSFTATLKILRIRIPDCPRGSNRMRVWLQRVLQEIGEEVLPPRRNRMNPRVIKRKMSKWKKKRAVHHHYPQPTQGFRDSIVMLR